MTLAKTCCASTIETSHTLSPLDGTTLKTDVAAWLTRRVTVAKLGELVEPFGLGHPDSVCNLLGRAEAAMK